MMIFQRSIDPKATLFSWILLFFKFVKRYTINLQGTMHCQQTSVIKLEIILISPNHIFDLLWPLLFLLYSECISQNTRKKIIQMNGMVVYGCLCNTITNSEHISTRSNDLTPPKYFGTSVRYYYDFDSSKNIQFFIICSS